MVLGKQQIVLGGVLVAALVAAFFVFRRGEEAPVGSSGRERDIERAIREELRDKQVCGFCMEPDAALHKVGDIEVKALGGDIYKASIAIECKAAPDGKPRTKVLMREYAFVEGTTVCTVPNLGWTSPEEE